MGESPRNCIYVSSRSHIGTHFSIGVRTRCISFFRPTSEDGGQLEVVLVTEQKSSTNDNRESKGQVHSTYNHAYLPNPMISDEI